MTENFTTRLVSAASAAIAHDGDRIPLSARDPGRAAVAAVLRELGKDLRQRSSEYNADELMTMATEIERKYWNH